MLSRGLKVESRFSSHIKRYGGLYAGGFGLFLCAMSASSAMAEGTAATVSSIDDLGATIKGLVNNSGKLIIDGGILAAAGYGAVVTKSPAVVILGCVSVAIFHLALAVFLK